MKTSKYLFKKHFTIGLLLAYSLTSQAIAAPAPSWFASPTGTGSDCLKASPCTLTMAVDRASAGDTIYLAGGHYTSSDTAVLFIRKNLTLLGGWDGTTQIPTLRDTNLYESIIDGQSTRQGIYIDSGLYVTLDGLTIASCKHFDSGAGLYASGANSVTLNNVRFVENYAHDEGSDLYGGGAYISGGSLTIENSAFIKNSVNGKDTQGYGGGLAINNADTTIKSTRFEENDAEDDSSALYFRGNSADITPLNITTSTFIDNSKQTSISAYGSELGTFSAQYADINITDSTFKNNNDIAGTTIESDHSRLLFINNIVANNKGLLSSLYIYESPFFAIANSIFYDNNVSDSSETSAIFIQQGTGIIVNNTIANNAVDNAIAIGSEGSTDNIDMLNNIITGHSVGVLLESASTLDIDYTLWGEGATANGSNITSTGTLIQDHHIIGDPAYVNAANGDYHIRANSAAKDRADLTEIKFDIDNDERPQGDGFDIGADEFVNNTTLVPIIHYLLF